MKEERNPVVEQIARFGLPLVILIFYCTASLGFEYTPDSTFQTLQIVRHLSDGGELTSIGAPYAATPSPLWMVLLTLGSRFHLDLLLTTKVFSLFFSCFAILMSYLVAFEVLRDRVLGFCLALVVALQPWLVQAAPSGSALPLGLMLTLASIFFLLRNEYLLATFFVGLSTLVFREAIVLMGLLIIDMILNSVDKSRARKVILGLLLVYCSTLLPWILYAVFKHMPVTPVLISIGELPGWTFAGAVAFAVLVMLTVLAVIMFTKSGASGRLIVRTQTAALLWVCCLIILGFSGNREFLYLGIPLLLVYAFMGLREFIIARRLEHLVYTAAFVFTGLLLVQSQLASSKVKATMKTSIEDAQELISIAYWLKANTSPEATVAADKPGIIEYYADRAIDASAKETGRRAEYVIAKVKSVESWEVVYRPSDLGFEFSTTGDTHFALWKKR